MLRTYSVSYKMDQNKKRRNKNSVTNEEKKKSIHINRYALHEDVANFLLNINFTIEQIFTAFQIYKFQTIEEAVNVMLKDPDTGKFNHRYIETQENHCKICGNIYAEHFEYNHFQANEEEINLEIPTAEVPRILKETVNTRNQKIEEKYCDINQIKINFPQSVIEEFEDPTLCQICFSERLNSQTKVSFKCNHEFCQSCVIQYLSTKILKGDVLEIKCLYAGCQRVFSKEEVHLYVNEENWNKYKKFLNYKLKFNHNNLRGRNCPFPDCEEVINISSEELIVECDMGHKSCSKCLQIGWHEIGSCKNYENSLLRQILQASSNELFKQCPNCKVVIEKNEGCNHMKCLYCDYEFCWLCLKEYTSDHYSIYNFTGCPGMKYKNNKEKTIWDNKCIKCLWFLLSCLAGVLLVILIIMFYLLFGCPYEFIKCYLENKTDNIEDNYSENGLEHYNLYNQNENGEIDWTCKRVTICIILGMLGLLLQPFYLLFFILYGMMECFSRFGCWIFWVSY